MTREDTICFLRQLQQILINSNSWKDVKQVIRESFSMAIEALGQPEQKKGKWIVDGHHIQCNVCHVYMCDTDREGDSISRSFCPNCGAKMEE